MNLLCNRHLLNRVDLKLSDSYYWKGLGILLIALHNFCHSGLSIENEHTFHISNTYLYFSKLCFSKDFLFSFFSYFGHIGIFIFIFLSGYGLSRKYDNVNLNRSKFLWNHVKKFWVLTIPIIFLYSLAFVIFRHESVSSHFYQLVAFLTFSSRFWGLPYYYGPWWFILLSFQFLLLYVFIFHKFKSRIVLVSFVSFSLILQMHFLSTPSILSEIRYNSIGFLLPFCLGIYISRYGTILSNRINTYLLLFIFFIISNFNPYLWLLQPIAVCVPIYLVPSRPFVRFLEGLGELSMYVFVLQGVFYTHSLFSYIPINRHFQLIAYVFLFVIFSFLYRFCLRRVFPFMR